MTNADYLYGEYLIKVKQRYAPILLLPDTTLTVSLTFKYYCMDKAGTLLQGYYTMMKVMNKCPLTDHSGSVRQAESEN